MKILIKNIHIIDTFSGKEIKNSDILIQDATIKKIGHKIKIDLKKDDMIIDGKDCIFTPAFTDIHTHLREPGFEYKEDISTGTMAAIHGGFTRITSFPNTKPVIDSIETLAILREKIRKKAKIEVLPIAAITKNQEGKKIVEIEKLKKYVYGFTDDGKGIQDPKIAREAMIRARENNVLLLLHEEDTSYGEGVVNNSIAEKLKVKGIKPESEESMIARDIILAKDTKARVHICHVSTKLSAKLLKIAKEEGINITGEVTPHHLCFDDTTFSDFGPNMKMSPPLRREEDRLYLIEAFKEGIIDCIATDHAPHAEYEKKDLNTSSFGITGLETAFLTIYNFVVKKGLLSLYDVIKGLTTNPSKTLSLEKTPIIEGAKLNFIIFNKKEKIIIDNKFFFSKSKNFPLRGEMEGKITYVFYDKKFFKFTDKYEEGFL